MCCNYSDLNSKQDGFTIGKCCRNYVEGTIYSGFFDQIFRMILFSN